MTNELVLGGTLQIRDEAKREVECFVLPWETDAETERGLERFEKGSFAGHRSFSLCVPAAAPGSAYRTRHQSE